MFLGHSKQTAASSKTPGTMTESQLMDQRSSTAQLHDLTLLISTVIDVNIGNTPTLAVSS